MARESLKVFEICEVFISLRPDFERSSRRGRRNLLRVSFPFQRRFVNDSQFVAAIQTQWLAAFWSAWTCPRFLSCWTSRVTYLERKRGQVHALQKTGGLDNQTKGLASCSHTCQRTIFRLP
jgi:hypothetical protein